MISRDLMSRAPTWEELADLEILNYWEGYSGVRKQIVLNRIDRALEENATRQSIAKDKRECDRLDEERVTLHTIRKLQESV